MYKNLIKKYASGITKEDIIKLSHKEKIDINKNEINLIYNSIHYDLEKILKNPFNYLQDKKYFLSPKVYNKILEYLEKYKKFIE